MKRRKSMSKKNKNYTQEFKQDAVNYYYSSGNSMSDTANALKVATSTLCKWINSAKENQGDVTLRGSGNYSSDSEKEIARLKKELRDSKDALDILKKAIGILNN